MKKGISFLFLFVLLLSVLQGQNLAVKGKIIDKASNDPIEYANIQLNLKHDSSFLSGAISNEKGLFKIDQLEPGIYSLKISFVGYQSILIEDVNLASGTINLGDIGIELMNQDIDEVSISASKSPVSYKVDRKVIDANSFPSADVAIDLLENVPSLQLDYDGRLTYRGDGTFKVYINGRPVTNGEEKLRQMPAALVDKIEIVTNPSARYDSEGTAGIIHVILKKNKLEGYAISSSLTAGTRNNVDWLFSIDKKGKKGGWYVNGNIGKYIWGETRINQQQTIKSNNNTYLNNFSKNKNWGGFSQYLEVGFNYDITEKDNIDFSGHINPFKQTEFQFSEGSYNELSYDENGELIGSEFYDNTSEDDLYYQYTGATLSYEHAFNKKRSHLLSAYVTFSTYLRDLEETMIDTKDYQTYIEKQGYVSREKNETTVESELSYLVPFSESIGLEAGFKISTDHIPEITSVSGTFDDNGDITPFQNEPINQEVYFTQDIYAGFITFQSEWKKLALQLGGRVEYTDRTADYKYMDHNGDEVFVPGNTNFTDFFPSAHLTYSQSESNQYTISYSRRIERPRYFRLVPIKKYYSPFSYSVGNGALLPSYSNSFDLGYRKSWDKDFVGVEVFARTTSQVIQSYTRTDTLNILYYIPENVGNSISVGTELMAGIDIFSWWNLNVSTSIFYYKLDVDIDQQYYTDNQFRSSARLNNTFKLPKSFTLKWGFRYNSPRITAQSKHDGYFYSDISMKKGFKDNNWTVLISFSNLFTGITYHTVTSGNDFTVETTTVSEPYAQIKVTYLLNNQK